MPFLMVRDVQRHTQRTFIKAHKGVAMTHFKNILHIAKNQYRFVHSQLLLGHDFDQELGDLGSNLAGCLPENNCKVTVADSLGLHFKRAA